ncbi:MAG TPA: tetratricopeptide repeat protein, partial [Leptospiraceae bacterium]|nr:tetratricopeptide repeat protein [Leptospiraceae bacterium]
FKQIFEWAKDDSEIFLRTGLSLQLMGRYKEAEAILSRSPGVSALPSFEERHQEFAEKIEKISSFEKRNDLSFDEMRDLGFAYLFNSDFTKAEEVFKKASLALK